MTTHTAAAGETPRVLFESATAEKDLRARANTVRIQMAVFALICAAVLVYRLLTATGEMRGATYEALQIVLNLGMAGVITTSILSPLLPDRFMLWPNNGPLPTVQCRGCQAEGWPEDLEGDDPHAGRACPSCGHTRFDVTRYRRGRVSHRREDVAGADVATIN